jgi:hypothetical protein
MLYLAAMVTLVLDENYWPKGQHAQLIQVAMGQKATFRGLGAMSAMHPKADMSCY